MAALLALRRYPEALAAAERALTLAPANLSADPCQGAWSTSPRATWPGRGQVLRAVRGRWTPRRSWPTWPLRGDLYWVLDDAQQRLLLRLSPAPFDDSRADWGLALAETLRAPGGYGSGPGLC